MSVVRIEALRALAAWIELRIPELAGHVCPGQAPSGEMEHVPNLSIQPGKWAWLSEQQTQHATLPGNRVVYHVGTHEAPCVLSIIAGSPAERWTIEDKVLDLFRGAENAEGWPTPGVLVFPVAAIPELSRWACSFDLESDEWIPVGMDRRCESRIATTATIPALTVDTPVYTIAQLRLALEQQASSTAPPSAVEVVTINDDGTISPAT